MHFYLAGKYQVRPMLQDLQRILVQHGHQIQCRWLSGSHEGLWTPAVQAGWALEDLEDIQACESLVMIQWPVDEPEPSTGRHIEFGYALAKQKQLMLIGRRTSVFHFLPEIQRYETITDFLTVYAPGALWDW